MEYEHLCKNCQHEWEEEYSIKADPPTLCPNCKVEGFVNRLISGGSGKGIVELTGHELKERDKKEVADLKREAARNENVLANLVGETKYQQKVVEREKASANRPKFRR